MRKWEYLVDQAPKETGGRFNEWLNYVGRHGWELVLETKVAGRLVCVFKCPIEEPGEEVGDEVA